MLTLKDFEISVGSILAEVSKEKFTGKVNLEINFGEGGIRNVSVTKGYEMRAQRKPIDRMCTELI